MTSKCEICADNDFKYICPTCKMRYCSLQCYRDTKHLSCSENFYKLQVEEHLRGVRHVPGSTIRDGGLANVDLYDQATEHLSGPEFSESFLEFLASHDPSQISDADLFNGLSADDQRKFAIWCAKASSNPLMFKAYFGDSCAPWSPWWTKLDATSTSEQKGSRSLPASSRALTHGAAFKKLDFAVPLVFSYVAIARQYDGEHMVHRHEAATDILSLIPRDQSTSGLNSSLTDCANAFCSLQSQFDSQTLIQTCDDLLAVLAISNFKGLSRALSELGQLLESADAGIRYRVRELVECLDDVYWQMDCKLWVARAKRAVERFISHLELERQTL